MNAHSELGEIIGSVLIAKRAAIVREYSLLRGWTQAPEMYSLRDIAETFANAARLRDGAEMMLAHEVAQSIVGYRGSQQIEHDGAQHCAMEFHKRYGSFMLVFRCGGERTVLLYHMGLALYPKERMHKTGMKGEEDITPLGTVCSRFARVFSARLDDQYFELRDAIVGKHGFT